MNLEAVIEGMLFVVGDDGLSIEQLSNLLEVSDDEVKQLIRNLQEEYRSDKRGIRIDFLGDKIKLTTKKEHHQYYQKLLMNESSTSLSQAALETLAIIAYNQPITRIKIDNLRGIASGQMIRKLVAKGFVKEVGRSDLPGRPIIYETTSEFLDYFGLASINDLPDISEFMTNNEESSKEENIDLYQSKYVDVDEEY